MLSAVIVNKTTGASINGELSLREANTDTVKPVSDMITVAPYLSEILITPSQGELNLAGSMATPVNSPPVLQIPTFVQTNLNRALALSGGNLISVTDTVGTGNNSESLTLSVSQGKLTFGSAVDLTISGNGTASLTVSGTLSALNTALASLVYTPTTGYSGVDTLNLTIKDITDQVNGTAAAVAINVNPPVVVVPSVRKIYAPTLMFSDNNQITITDTAGAGNNNVSLALSVQQGTLKFGSTTGITVGGNGTSSLNVSGTLSSLNAALTTLVYTPNTGFSGLDMLNLTPQDTTTHAKGAATQLAINVNPPLLHYPATVYTGLNTPLMLSGNNLISVTDTAGTGNNGESLTLSVSHGTVKLGSTNGLTTVSGNGTGLLSFNGTLSALNAALSSLVYTPTTGYTGVAALIMTIKDTTDQAVGYVLTMAITVNAPTLQVPASLQTNQNTALLLSGSNLISVKDPAGSGNNNVSLMMFVTHGTLGFTSTTALTITGNWSAFPTVSGTISALNKALSSLIYTPANGYTGSDTFYLNVTDTVNQLSGAPITLTINVNPPPVVHVPTFVETNLNTALVLSGSNLINVTDDAGTGNDTESLTLEVAHGSLMFGSTTGLTISGNDTASLKVSGALSALNTALESLVYTPTKGFSGVDMLNMAIEDTKDQLIGNSAAFSINVNPPVVVVPTVRKIYTPTLTFSGSNLITLTDSAGAGNNIVTLTLTVQEGTLKFGSSTGLTFSNNWTPSLIVTGTLSALNAAIPTLVYTPNVGFSGLDTLTVVAQDTTTQAMSATTQLAININPPLLHFPATVSTGLNTPLALSGSNLISVTDTAGTGNNSESLTLSLTHGTLKLGSTTGLLTVSGNGTDLLTFSGTLSALNAALGTLVYTPTTGYTGAAALIMTIKDTTDQAVGYVLTMTINVNS